MAARFFAGQDSPRAAATGWRRWMVALVLGLGCIGGMPAKASEPAAVALPPSLAQWYKPRNKRHVFLHLMFALRRELQAVREYAATGDGERALAWAGRLERDYWQIGRMVPEWKRYLDDGLLQTLMAAVRAEDGANIFRAADRLDESCDRCHREYQALAALKYRTVDFDHIELVEGQADSRYPAFMKKLGLTVNRIRIAAEDGRWGAAGMAARRLRDQLALLGRGCTRCHRERASRERILGGGMLKAFTELQRAIARKDLKQLRAGLGRAAVSVCARCHSLHKLGSDLRKRLFD